MWAKGKDPLGTRRNVASDIIFAERRGQSQKPIELYELIEQFVPNGSSSPQQQHNNASRHIFSSKLPLRHLLPLLFLFTGRYLEIFGRRNNLRNGWVTLGNEL